MASSARRISGGGTQVGAARSPLAWALLLACVSLVICALLVVTITIAGCGGSNAKDANDTAVVTDDVPVADAAVETNAADAVVATDTTVAADTALVAGVPLADHPYQLAPLTRNSRFPRFTAQELAAAGYPDHLHAFLWPRWQPLVTAAGDTFGPGSLCRLREVQPQPGLAVEPGDLRYRNLRLLCNEAYKPCDMLPFIELLDWAGYQLQDLLDIEYDHTLVMVNPDNTQHYRQLAGVGTWRLYTLDGDSCIVQPVPVLSARTLIGHAAFLLMTEWSLRGVFGGDLPPWLVQGLAEYLAEDGVHLNNYMAQFRREGPVLLPPPLVDHVLGSAPDPDLEADRKHYRQACYSAFLMVWELIEQRGGLETLRRFLGELKEGATPDTACVAAYGFDLAELTAQLDATQRPEPIGTALQARAPHKPPPEYDTLQEVYERYE